ncbi:MAG: LpxD N-terminal domain-containing protein, partial [Gemmatimonadales bacterium]
MTAQAVAALVGGRLSGPGDVLLSGVRSLDRAGPGELTVCTGHRYAGALAASRAGAVLVSEAMVGGAGPATRIVVADPSAAMALVARALHPIPPATPGIAPTAQIGAGISLGADVSIGAFSVIGSGVRIGDRVRIASHVVVGDGVTLGNDVRLDSHVMIYDGAVLGHSVWCKAAAVVGGTGFG